ncbi:hypothetical protein [Piscinibacter sp.]|uniref:hypothetical protein n=1 Tax=Piscinibacter sp. TaxID=1903157 RepID=UPI002BC20D32|nr:hypothetical protein [Albitalea sp.]HUG24783.1 hypothetical protein [Albitalea sp.]
MTKRLIEFTLLALAAGTLLSLRRQAQRRADTRRGEPAPVQTWEGEGGALPASGPQTGPGPVVPASPHSPSSPSGSVH